MTLLTLLSQPPVLLVECRQGAGLVASRTLQVEGDAAYTTLFDLTAPERALITDWSQVQIWVTSQYGRVRIPMLQLTAPGGFLVFAALGSSVPLSGGLQRTVLKPVSSSVTPAGVATKLMQKAPLTSSVTPAGTLQKTILKPLASVITAAGALTQLVKWILASSVTPSGTVTKLVKKQTFTSTITPASAHTIQKVITLGLASTVTAAGTLLKTILKPLTSSVTPSGVRTGLVKKTLTGTVTAAGTLTRLVVKLLSSTVTPSGIRTLLVKWTLTSTVSPSGVVTRQTQVRFTSTVALAGVLAKRVSKSFASSIGLSGTVTSVVQSITITRRFLINALQRVRLVAGQATHRLIAALRRIRTVYPDEDTMADLPEVSPKRSAEADNFTVDFVNQLNVGETLNTPTVTITVSSATEVADVLGTTLTLSGGALTSGTKVVQKLTGGTNGVLYVVAFRVLTSAGRTLEQAIRLLVKDATA